MRIPLALAWSTAVSLGCGLDPQEPADVVVEPGTLLLASSLDGPATVQAPEVGSGAGAAVWTLPTDHFVQTLNGQGVLLNADGQWVRFAVRDPETRVPNLDLDAGTVALWLRPAFPVLDGVQRDLFGALDERGHGIRIAKAGRDRDNALEIELIGTDDRVHLTRIDADRLPWLLLAWVRVRVAWDATGRSEQNVRVWVDEVELPYESTTNAVVDLPRLPDDASMYWGAWGIDDPQAIRATLDELEVWAGVVEP